LHVNISLASNKKTVMILFRRILALVVFFPFILKAQTPAFPGAEGFGKYASGGRGGQVAIVTSLEDDGEGSLRRALIMYPGEPLTVIFNLSGIITLQSPLVLKRSNVTIAGQTAPGSGICLKGHSFIINGAARGGNHGNIIIRYIRSRPGADIRTGVYGFDMENCQNVIIDHCSFSWANEECAAMYDIKNTTVQWCIVSEGLYNAGHQKGTRAYGGVWGGQYASYHHNLIAHQNSRAVRFNGSRAHDTIALVDYRNNVIFNWGSANAPYGGDVTIKGGFSRVNLVNNYYAPGPATALPLKFMKALHAGAASTGTGQWYLAGNIMDGNKSLTRDNWKGLDLSDVPDNEKSAARSATAFHISEPLPVQSAGKAFTEVMEHAGASLPRRDDVDRRIVREVKSRKASGKGSFGKQGIIDSPLAVGGWPEYHSGPAPADSDRDGMPDEFEKKNELNPNNPADRNNLNSEGYTMLEVYLNSVVPQKQL
jgi:hypothetical protein